VEWSDGSVGGGKAEPTGGGETVYTARIEVLVKSQVVAFAYTWTRFSLLPAVRDGAARRTRNRGG